MIKFKLIKIRLSLTIFEKYHIVVKPSLGKSSTIYLKTNQDTEKGNMTHDAIEKLTYMHASNTY